MRTGHSSSASKAKKPNVFERFRAELAREDLRLWSATFSEPDLEDAYQRHLIHVELPKIRMVCVAGVFVWFGFSILDVLTITENLAAVSVIRWLVAGPIAVILTLMICSDRFKRHYGLLTVIGMASFSLAIIAMIALMPRVGAPPYIIGVLITFVYSSCFCRISFALAATVYVVSAVIYSAMLVLSGDFSNADVIAGHFFMGNMALIAVITHYAQEIRSRQIWQRNRQRALDAAYIEELLIEATAADQSKLNFMSILSHELRTPLHQIIGFSEIIQQADEVTNGKTSEFASDIRSSAHELLSRIGKMLRYADATAGKIKYEPEKVPLNELVETALLQTREAVAAKRITVDTNKLQPAKVFVDHIHTAYAIGHILENAVRASAKESRISISGAMDGDGAYTLEIEDFGVGMDDDKVRAAFEPFSQVEQVRTRSIEGLGLGLTLARKIFLDQQADLSLASVKGEGTIATIRFALPATSDRLAA